MSPENSQQSKTDITDDFPFIRKQPMLTTLLQEMQDGILICDANGKILFANQPFSNLSGLPKLIAEQTVEEAIPDPDFWPMVQETILNDRGQDKEISLLVSVPSGNGFSNRKKFFDLHMVPISLPVGDNRPEVQGCLVTLHDMTDVRQTEKMRRDFVANVSHELRTPLSAIKGYSETLLDGALEDQEVSKDFVEVIHKHALRLTHLVEDLLDLSKLESPDFRLDFQAVDLSVMVPRVVSMIQSKADDKEISLSWHIDESLTNTKVLAHPSSLEQVITNLTDNAIKYTPAKGSVNLALRCNEKLMTQVDISDTGMGIEAKHLPRIFQRFYRVDKARSRDMGGTGLGLSIVKHIVQLHGGKIWVESELNQGSTFHFTLVPYKGEHMPDPQPAVSSVEAF